MPPVHPRVIPSYGLYGDQAAPAWKHSFDFEWIPQRSTLYNWHIQPHRHDAFLQLLYLTAGGVQTQIDDASFETEAPCLVVVPAGHVHSFRFAPETQGPVVTASQQSLESLAHAALPELLTTIRHPAVITLTREMRYVDRLMALFLSLEQEARTPAQGQMAAGMSLLLAILVQVMRLSPRPGDAQRTRVTPNASRKAKQVERFRQMVDEHFRQSQTVADYARELGVSPGQLTRLCREVLDRSALQVIHDRMVHEAQRNLVYTTLPIKVVASELGFADDAYFSRFFRQQTGLTPRTFRARAILSMAPTPEAD